MHTAKVLSKLDLEKTWEQYWRSGRSDPISRNSLMLHYFPTVQFIAYTLHLRLQGNSIVDKEDLESAGNFGLNQAIGAFDPERRIKFPSYAQPRIRGAMLDMLRDQDWMSRRDRTHDTKLNRVNDELYMVTGLPPTAEETRKQGAAPKKFLDRVPSASFHIQPTYRKSRIVSRNDPTCDEPSPAKKAMGNDLREALFIGLSRKARLILILYHFEGFSLKEAGKVLGVCESRARQLHTEVINTLRTRDSLRMLYAPQ